jgi:hypothetical protein
MHENRNPGGRHDWNTDPPRSPDAGANTPCVGQTGSIVSDRSRCAGWNLFKMEHPRIGQRTRIEFRKWSFFWLDAARKCTHRFPVFTTPDKGDSVKEEVFGLLADALEVIQEHRLRNRFSTGWLCRADALVYPPDETDLTARRKKRHAAFPFRIGRCLRSIEPLLLPVGARCQPGAGGAVVALLV